MYYNVVLFLCFRFFVAGKRVHGAPFEHWCVCVYLGSCCEDTGTSYGSLKLRGIPSVLCKVLLLGICVLGVFITYTVHQLELVLEIP